VAHHAAFLARRSAPLTPITSKRSSPRGQATVTISPAATPSRARPTGRLDRHTPLAAGSLDRPDQLVLERLVRLKVAQPDGAADAGTPVPVWFCDPRRRQPRLERGDPPLELGLLLERVDERRVVFEVAVRSRVAEPLADRSATLGSQLLELRTEPLVVSPATAARGWSSSAGGNGRSGAASRAPSCEPRTDRSSSPKG
jgi:hypothetical protein